MRYSSYEISIGFTNDRRVEICVEWEDEDMHCDEITLSIPARQMRRLLDGEIDRIEGA